MSGPLPAVAKTVRVDFHFSQSTDSNMQIRSFFAYTGALSVTDATTWVGNIATAMGVFTVNRMTNGVLLVKTVLTDLTSLSAAQAISTTSATGASGGSPLAQGTALIIKHQIARRYRGGKPRSYIPGMRAGVLLNSGTWDPAFLPGTLSDWNTYISAAIANTNPAAIGVITNVSVSYFHGFTVVTNPITGRAHNVPTPRVTPVVDVIVGNSINPKPGSQRRRNEQA